MCCKLLYKTLIEETSQTSNANIYFRLTVMASRIEKLLIVSVSQTHCHISGLVARY